MPNYMRNISTGEIKTVEPDSAEFNKLKAERTGDGRFPLWEQTGAHDADPKAASSDFEVTNRSKWDADLHDVTTDGVLQSGDDQFAAAAAASSSSKPSQAKS
jgi:hypothetical protein